MSARFRLAAALSILAASALLAALPIPAGATSASFRFTTTKLLGSDGFSEPRATVTPDGTRYVDTNQKSVGTEIVYASHDGISWKRTPGVPPDQTQPTTDVDIVSTRTGRLIASELDFTGINFITAWSDDKGKTWTESTGTTYADTDRQWLAVGPDDPSSHQPTVYLLFHNLLSGSLSHNMFVMTSKDGGKSFGAPIPVSRPGQQDWADLQCADSGGPSNIFYDAKSKRVFVVFGTRSSAVGGCGAQPVEINVVAANRVWVVEAPAGQTTSPLAWTPHLAVNDTGPPAHIVGMQLAPAASDTAGNVYVAYPESVHDYPNYDGGAIKVVHASGSDLDHWSAPSVVAKAGGAGNVLPHIIAGSPGRIDVAYYHGILDGTQHRWYSYAAQSLDALSAHPHWTTTSLSSIQVEPHQTASQLMGACMQGTQATLNGFACGRAADVYGIALDRRGYLLLTWPAQANLPTDATYVSQQVAGASLFASPAGSSGRGTGTRGSGSGPASGTGNGLPASGGGFAPAVVGAVLLLMAGLAARGRRAHRPG